MSAEDFRRLSIFAYSQSGIVLSESKQEMVYSRLIWRLRTLGDKSFRDYLRRVENNVDGESTIFLNAITTNLTSFFRENHHFEFLKDTVIPELKRRLREERKIRIWCAAASTGEESYSLAIVFREAFASASDWDVNILATDLDSTVLETAQRGIYPVRHTEGMDEGRKKKWFRAHGEDKLEVDESLKEMITFKQLNLMDKWPMLGVFNIIFCRNVIIYFDQVTRKKLFERMSTLIDGNSYLFLGHSENLMNVSDGFQSLGRTVYKPKSGPTGSRK